MAKSFVRALGILGACLLAGCGANDGSRAADRGAVAFRARDWKAAAKAYAEAADKCPTNLAYRIRTAVAALAMGELKGAASALGEARALAPDSVEVRRLEGQLAYRAKDWDTAEKIFRGLLAAGDLPKDVRGEIRCDLAVTEYAAAPTQTDRVRFDLYRALRLNRRNPAAWYHLGVLSRDVYRDDAAALEQFQMAGRLSDPADPRTREIQGVILPQLRAAATAAAAKLPAGVPKQFQEALAAARKLERSAKTRNDADRVLEAYRVALVLKPSAQATYLAAARFALQKGRVAQASAILDHALAHEPESKQAVDLMIDACRRANQPKAAAWEAYRRELRQ